MQNTSKLYQALLADPRHRKEYKVVIAGEDYGEDRIISLYTAGGLFEQDTVCIGSAVAREIDLAIRDPGDIPKGAKLCPWYRLALGDQVSEWISRGTFYIDTRETDRNTGVMTIHGFDDMMRAEQPWEPDQSLNFPLPMDQAAAELARLLGVELDPRTKLRSDYFVDYPTTDPESDEPVNNNYTWRNILQFIAAAHGGNWTMTEEGKLRLVRLRDLQPETNYLVTEMGRTITLGGVRILIGPAAEDTGATATTDKAFVGRRAASVQSFAEFDPVTKIIVNVDDDNYYEVGNDTGQTLEITCPYGTQEMANDLLAELGGYAYKPLQAQDALIDPAVELGDGVTVDGVYIMLAQMDTTFDALMASDIGAPGQREIESEIGRYESPLLRSINRKMAQTRSLITKTAEEIRLEVASTVNNMSAEFSVTLDSITQRVEGLDGKYAEVQLTIDGLTISGPDGVVRIRGSGIDTTSLAANSISADAVNMTGAITWSDLARSVQNDISDAYQMAQDADGVVSSWAYTYRGKTYIDGTMLMIGTVMASYLLGGTVGLLDSSQSQIGGIDITNTQTGNGLEFWTNRGGIRISSAGNFWVDCINGSFGMSASRQMTIQGSVVPYSSGSYDLGTSSSRWADIYATNGEIQTSDENLKHDIEPLPEKYLDMLDNVEIYRYKLNDGTSGRYHPGFVSQQVKTAMDAAGVDPMEFGGFVIGRDEKEKPVYMLRYQEFIPLLLAKVRQLEEKIKRLEVST